MPQQSSSAITIAAIAASHYGQIIKEMERSRNSKRQTHDPKNQKPNSFAVCALSTFYYLALEVHVGQLKE